MDKKRMMLVGGNFEVNFGKDSKRSKFINKMVTGIYNLGLLQKYNLELDWFNGGSIERLKELLDRTVNYDIVIWIPRVDNSEEKIRNVKEVNPRTILINSKVNNGRYTFMELIKKSLDQKANLTIEMNTSKKPFEMMIFDPLANSYYDGDCIECLVKNLIQRARFLSDITRKGSTRLEGEYEVPNQEAFFKFVKESGEVFHNIIEPVATTRFLGNSSFRCEKGFPSFRDEDGIIFMSRRNIDKRFIGQDGFVPTKLNIEGKVMYYGDHKPSVDTPIQLELYKAFPKINYMIHAHVYVEGGVFTDITVPCGAIEEVSEIFEVAEDTMTTFEVINLKGHGCIIMAEKVADMAKVKFYKRPTPEKN